MFQCVVHGHKSPVWRGAARSALPERDQNGFPGALSSTVSPGTLSSTIKGLGQVTGSFTATCQSGCGGATPPTPPTPVLQANAAASQAATLGTVALATTTVQTTNIGLRLNALRGGATGLSTSGLSFNLDGKPVMLAGVTPFNLDGKPVMLTGVTGPLPGNGGNGASADKTGPLSRLGVFANGQGSFGDQDATSREPGFDFHTAGLTVGADYRILDPLVVGLAFGYLRTNTSTDAAAGDSRVNGYSFSIYGNYYVLPKLYIDAIVMGGWNNYDVKRNTPTGVAEAEPGGNQFSIGSSVGYDFSMAGFTFGPTARVTYVRIHIDGYQETGAGPSNSRVGSQTVESVTTDLGGQINYAISFGWGVLSPLLRFEWEHEYKGGSRIVNAGLVSDPATSVAFATSKPDRDYFNLGAGITATLPRGIGAFFYFEEQIGRSGFTNHTFTGGVRIEF